MKPGFVGSLRWLLWLPLTVIADPVKIEAFTDPVRFPIIGNAGTDAVVSIQDITGPERLEQEISAGLPKDKTAAMAVASQRVNANLEALAARFTQAYESHGQAMGYGLRRYPALVFENGRAVIYGVTDVREGLTRYRQWLATHPQAATLQSGTRSVPDNREADR